MRLGERTSTETYRFEGKVYTVGRSYTFSELPKGVQKDVLSQSDDIEAHYGHSARAAAYRLVMVPHESVVQMLQDHFGEETYSKTIRNPKLISFAHQIEREGLQQPPALDEGWRRAFALAYLGWDMPYFTIEEGLEMPNPTFIPTLEGRRLGETLYRYTLKYRPPGFATLPKGWALVERPQIPGFDRREDLPVSRHRFGVVAYERPLTDKEIQDYELDPV